MTWRSLKYEDIYLKGYADGQEARAGISAWIAFYNGRRPHQALADRTPMAVSREGTISSNSSAQPAARKASRCGASSCSPVPTRA